MDDLAARTCEARVSLWSLEAPASALDPWGKRQLALPPAKATVAQSCERGLKVSDQKREIRADV